MCQTEAVHHLGVHCFLEAHQLQKSLCLLQALFFRAHIWLCRVSLSFVQTSMELHCLPNSQPCSQTTCILLNFSDNFMIDCTAHGLHELARYLQQWSILIRRHVQVTCK